MRRGLAVLLAFHLTGAVAFAHGDNEHIRGTVTQIRPNAITIQTAEKPSKTVTVTIADHTTFDKGGHAATMGDLKVGDRVVIDVPKGTLEAHSVKIGTTTSKTPQPPPEHKPNGGQE